MANTGSTPERENTCKPSRSACVTVPTAWPEDWSPDARTRWRWWSAISAIPSSPKSRAAQKMPRTAPAATWCCATAISTPRSRLRYAQSLMEKRVDGILMNSVAALSKKQEEQLSGLGVPDRAAQSRRAAQCLLHRLRRQRSRRRAGRRVSAESGTSQDRAPHRPAPSRQYDGARAGLRAQPRRSAQAGEADRAARQE